MRRGTWVVFTTTLVFVLALSGGALAGKPADPGKGKAKNPAAGQPADKGGGNAAAAPTPAWQGGWIHDYTEAASTEAQSDYYVVVFDDPSAANYAGGIRGLKATKPAHGQKLNPRSEEVRAYGDYLKSVHANYRAFLNGKAPAAEVVSEFTLVANAVAVKANGANPESLHGPGVKSVVASWVYQPTMTVSNDLIGSPALWAGLGGREAAGTGIKVGIIDSGIRDDHPAFDCKGPIQHKVYTSGVAGFDPDRIIALNHGTHVAGTVAGCVLDLDALDHDELDVGPTSGIWSGVAPGASLFDYNVFPGFGGPPVKRPNFAFAQDICEAIEDAVADGMDVINMSLGGKVQGPHDILAECTNGAVAAGVVAAVAAGNSGPGDSTVESPGSAAGALTAGASTNPHFVGISASGTKDGGGAFSHGAALGDFENFDPAITAAYTVTTPANGCTAITNAVSGKIALIDRGVCTFSTKIRNAQTAGALGVLVVNNVAGDPTAMGSDGTANQPTIPAAMLGKAEGNAIKPTGTVTVDGTTPQEFLTANADIIAGFSSRGPTPFTYLIKPDVTAPGVNVYSSVFNEEEPDELGFAYFQGTSMASPHLAGSAALLLHAHPTWSPADVKSALVNTAARVVTDHVNGTTDPGVLARGGGRIDLAAATAAPAWFDPASVSFGFWSGNKPVFGSVAVTATGAACGPATVTGTAGVTVTVSGSAPGTLTVTLNGGTSAGSGDYSGDITLTCGGATLKIPWWTRIDRHGKP
jgi:minor extracellular serine protease Vpr